MTTYLADEGELQGNIENDLVVARCQLLGSVRGNSMTSQSARVEQ